MKILVISDTHGSVGPILTAIDRVKPDVIIHLGDGVSDLRDVNFKGQIYAVRGNHDRNPRLKKMGKLSYGKTVILYLHGDGYNVHNEREKLVNFVNQQGADIVLFGHSHKQEYYERNGVQFVNPGYMAERSTATYAVIEFKDEDSKPEITHHAIMD